MTSLSKWVKRREGLRNFFNSTAKTIEDYLKEESLDQPKLVSHKKTVLNILEQLATSDDEVGKLLKDDDVANDVFESMSFIVTANDLEAMIDSKLAQLNAVKNPPPSSISPSTTTNVCRLPKMELTVFKGDPLEWQGFWDQFQISIHDNERISDIDRFNYLKRYLGGEALGAVSGLNLSSENYKEAIELLRERFGNEQVLISAHMESLLKITKIKSKENIKGLRNLYNHVESCVRNLRSLKLETKGYGSLLIPLLKDKLPDDLTIIISRKFGSTIWTLDKVLEYLNDELRAQENCASSFTQHVSTEKHSKHNYTASGLHIQASKNVCIFCKKQHSSAKCRTVTNVASRKGILRTENRCFLCLEEDHNARDCKSKYVCRKCNIGKHHISICNKSQDTLTAFSYEGEADETTTLASNENGGILMQTAKAHILDTNYENVCFSRILFDTGSQRSYVSTNVRDKLGLKTVRNERVVIKTFGEDNNSKVSNLDVVQFKIKHAGADDVFTFIEALCVPKICCPLKGQHIDRASKIEEFAHLNFADDNSFNKDLPVGVLIGIDNYFRFFCGETIHSKFGTVASKSTLGWVLSGSLSKQFTDRHVSCMETLNMRCSVETATEGMENMDDLRNDLDKFWNVENIGSSQCVVSKFKHDIFHDGNRYVTKLPFKIDHDCLPDNFDVCKRRLKSLKNRLEKQNILYEYDQIFKDYEEAGIIERVPSKVLS